MVWSPFWLRAGLFTKCYRFSHRGNNGPKGGQCGASFDVSGRANRMPESPQTSEKGGRNEVKLE
jgi:hypothetical protein